MSITEGDVSANFRYNSRTGLMVPSTITDERQVVAAFTEFSGDYGFTLNETPQTDIAGITQVKRISDNQIFTHTNLATIGLTEYFFDYQNDIPILFFNSANNGEEFQIQYYGVGGAVNGKNLLSLVTAAGDSLIGINSKVRELTTKNNSITTTLNTTSFLTSIHNWTLQNNTLIGSGSAGTAGILEIFGNLDISNHTLTIARCLVIVYGNIIGSGTITSPAGAAGGNGRTAGGGGGGGGGGVTINLICLGTISGSITISPGKGGVGGLANQGTATSGATSYLDFSITGGVAVNVAGNGGGGGGGAFTTGGNGANAGTSAAAVGAQGGGGGGGSNTLPTPGAGGAVASLGGISGYANVMAAGGSGGTGGGSAAAGQGGQTGHLLLVSNYTSAPCTVDVTAVAGGIAGVATYYNNSLGNLGTWVDIFSRAWSYYTKNAASLL